MENTSLETVTVKDFKNQDIEISKSDYDAIKLQSMINVRNYTNKTLQAQGERTFQGKTTITPKTELQKIRENITKQLVRDGVIKG